MKLLQFTFLVLALSITPIFAQGAPAAQAPRMIEVEAYFVRATPETIAQVIAGTAASGGVFSEEQFAKILKALRSSDATIFANPRTVTISGQRGTISSVKELPYPSEYKRDEKSEKNYPVSFDRRNIGVTFDFEPVLGTNDRIQILAQPTVTNFLGFIDFSSAVPTRDSSLNTLAKGALAEGGIWQPVLSEFRVSTNLVLNSGQTTIMGGVAEEISPRAAVEKGAVKAPDDDRLIYVFVTARAIKEN